MKDCEGPNLPIISYGQCNKTRSSRHQTNIDKYRLAANITEYHLTTNHYYKL